MPDIIALRALVKQLMDSTDEQVREIWAAEHEAGNADRARWAYREAIQRGIYLHEGELL